ncbi:MAG: methyltransferase domain-containing protein, partial [Chitinophagaceae bacterium]|nr:methyltransferase domain-containing protein [Chitinophagaceae bacterium]
MSPSPRHGQGPGQPDYVLGSHGAEHARLGRQHAIWRDEAMAAWQRAGFGRGQWLLDLGSGPGFASADLAALVGPDGRVLGLDSARRFVAAAKQLAQERGLSQLETHCIDLASPDDWRTLNLPARRWHGAWCRWLAMFLPRLDPLLDLVQHSLRPGGRLVLHEYIRWDTFSVHPGGTELRRFMARCIDHWRAHGGDPDVASRLPALLEARGLRLLNCRSLLACSPTSGAKTRWLLDFVGSYGPQLQANGIWSEAEQSALTAELAEARQRTSLWLTPALVEMVWEQPGQQTLPEAAVAATAGVGAGVGV